MRPRFAFALSLMLLVPSVIAGSPSNSSTITPSAQLGTSPKVLLQQGFQQLYTSQLKPAEVAFRQAITLAQKSGDRPLEAAALLGLSETRSTSGHAEESLTIAQQALKIYRETKNRAGEAAALHRIGDAQSDLVQNEVSATTLQQSLAIWREVKDRQNEAWTLGVLGIVQSDQDQKTGLESMQQAIAILKEPVAPVDQLRQQYRQGIILAAIGSTQIKQKQFESARKTLQEALELGKKSGNLSVQQSALSNIAALYSNQKQPKEAIATYQQVLAIAQQLENRSAQVNIYSSIGNLFRQLEQYAEAQQAYQSALVLHQAELIDAQRSSARISEGIMQFQIGINYFNQAPLAYAQKQYQSSIDLATKALHPLEQAAIINKELIKNQSLAKTAWQLRARSYQMIGLSYSELRQYELALAANQKQQAIAKEIGDPEEEKEALSSALGIYMSQDVSIDDPAQYDKQLEVKRQIISLAQKLKEPKSEMLALVTTAQIYAFQGRLSEALEIYQQVLPRARAVQDAQNEFYALIGIARLYGDQGNYSQAIATNTQALQASRQPKFKRHNPSYESLALNNLGVNYKQQGRYAQALFHFQQANELRQNYYNLFTKGETLEAFRAICLDQYDPSDISSQSASSEEREYCTRPVQFPTGSTLRLFQGLMAVKAKDARQSRFSPLNNIGEVYSDQGELQKALLFHQKSLAIARETSDRDKEATSLNNIGATYRNLGDSPKAIAFSQQALKIAVDQGDRAREVTLRMNLGVIKSDAGRYAEASSEYQQSLKISRQFKQRYEESVILYSIAFDKSAQGKYTEAILNYQQALKIQQDINVPARVILSLVKLGDTYAQLGQYAKAVELHQQALALARKIGARQREATALSYLGEDDRLQGKFDSALTYQQQALSIAQTIQARLIESSALQKIGKIYTQQSQPQKALAVLQKAFAIAQETGRKPDEAAILRDLSQAQLQLGQSIEAQSSLQKAIALARETGDAPIEAQALDNLGQLFAQQKQPDLAIVFYKQSVKLTEDIRKGIRTLPKDQQQSYTETVADTYRQLADLLLKRDRVLEAQQVLDLLKIQELDNYLRNVRGTAPNLYELPPEQAILKKYNALNQSAIVLGQELNDLQQLAMSGKALTPLKRSAK